MPAMNHATLARQLKQLEKDGLISRVSYDGSVQKVEYSLTPIGERFSPVLEAIKDWGSAYIDYLGSNE